jgi:hypothetical protein
MIQFILGMAVSLYNWDKKFGPTGGSWSLIIITKWLLVDSSVKQISAPSICRSKK